MALKLQAQLGLDGSGFEAGLRHAGRLGTAFGGSLKSAVAQAFATGAITTITKKTIEAAGHIQDLSERLGVSTDFLQSFSQVAKQSGADLDTLTTALEKVREARDKALSGDAKSLAQFGAFGIGQAQLKSTRLEELISGPIAKAFESGDVQGKLGAAWRQLGGRGAGVLVASFTEGLSGNMAKVKASGKIWSEDVIQQLDNIGDKFTVLADRMVITWGNLLIKLLELGKKAEAGIGSTAAAVGAGTALWNWKDFFALIFAPLLDEETQKKYIKPFDTKAAKAAGTSTYDQYIADIKKDVAAREALRKQREAARASGGGVEPVQPNLKGRDPDSLTRIGGFLGTNISVIERIGTQTNKTLMDIFTVLQSVDRKLGNGGTQFPTS